MPTESILAYFPRFTETDWSRDAKLVAKGIIWILKNQNGDGSWGIGSDINKMITTEQALKAVLIATQQEKLPEIKKASHWVEKILEVPQIGTHKFVFTPELLALSNP